MTESQYAEENRGDHGPRDRADPHRHTDDQRGGGTGEREFGGAVHGERHLPADDQGADHAGEQSEDRSGDERLLDEVVLQEFEGRLEVEHPAHGVGELAAHA